MLSGSKKIVKGHGKEPTELEGRVAQEILNIEVNNATIKKDLQSLHISAARQVDVSNGRNAIIIFVPYKLLKGFRKIQKILVEELEKRFSGSHVLIVAQRTMLSKTFARSSKNSGPRPRSRTLKAVQEAILEDIVYPTEIVGKRLRVRQDGGKTLKVHLNPKERVNVEGKVDTFASVYKNLCKKDIVFEFPVERE